MKLGIMVVVEVDARLERKNTFEKIKEDLIEHVKACLPNSVMDVKSVEVFKPGGFG